MSVIFASSTCDLNLKTLKKVGIEVISLPYKTTTKKGLYSVDKFNFDEYYANPNFEVDLVKLKKLANEKLTEALLTGQDVLFMTQNAKYDVSYEVINPLIKELSKQFPNQKLEIVNCNNYSLGYGLIVYETGILNSKGESLTTIMNFINKFKKDVKTFIIPSTNANIKNKLTLVGGMIGVRPILQVVNGELKVLDNIRGTKKIISFLSDKIKNSTFDDVPVGIMCGKNTSDANEIENQIEIFNADFKIIKSNLNPVLLNFFGDKTIAISYYKKSRN